ncbi:putative amidase-like protein [Melghirimyces profundicolus]|uniref:Putative amidase-like protein n=1 Tax=Melghirimyces profundicolus TaxID=1242148 RepID=A0A2T6C4S0_9BACL|nr:amidase domain-containing protein [Melghirimyces profundicolus]PTX63305.1 putative amidase-like protein [Melghirimyces profundicolus]
MTTWFRGQNQLWVEGEPDRLFDWVLDGDADWVENERNRWLRIREQQREREIKPVKGETRIRVVREEKDESQVWMRLVVHQRFLYALSDRLFEQEEINGYRVSLTEGSDGWSIDECRLDETMDTDVDQGWTYYQPPEEGGVSGKGYNRIKAVQYAEAWWNGANPRYRKMEDDCTNFISQCIHAGEIPMDFAFRRDRGWWYKGAWENWSYSWAVANSLQRYLASGGAMGARRVSSPQELQMGDVICYDWDGNGRWQHNTIVTAVDPMGMPLVNAHTVNSRHRYWDYRDSHAWTPNVKYSFFHLEN